jgi:hypothetical protein
MMQAGYPLHNPLAAESLPLRRSQFEPRARMKQQVVRDRDAGTTAEAG